MTACMKWVYCFVYTVCCKPMLCDVFGGTKDPNIQDSLTDIEQ